jgi:hypothetical protein
MLCTIKSYQKNEEGNKMSIINKFNNYIVETFKDIKIYSTLTAAGLVGLLQSADAQVHLPTRPPYRLLDRVEVPALNSRFPSRTSREVVRFDTRRDFQSNIQYDYTNVDERKRLAIEAYSTLERNFQEGREINSIETSKAINILEAYLGDELYHATSAGLDTYPLSGTGSITFEAGEYWVRTIQIGAGTLKGEKYNSARWAEEAPRDFSYTYTLFFNRAGYNGEVADNTDARIAKILSKNTGIPAGEISVIDGRDGKIKDIVSSVSGDPGVVVTHRGSISESQPGHINYLPGTKSKFPLDNVAYVVGLFDIPYVQTTTEKPTRETCPPPKCDTEKRKEKIEPEPMPAPEPVDTIKLGPEHRLMFYATPTDKGIMGFAIGVQPTHKGFFKDVDFELGYNFNKQNSSVSIFSQENAQHPTLPNYSGHSEMTLDGDVETTLRAFSANVVRYVAANKKFGVSAGLTATQLSESLFNGTEDHKTWVENERTGEKMAYDNFVIDNIVNKKVDWRIAPQIGARLHLGRMVAGMDYMVNLKNLTPDYMPDFQDLGNVRFYIGINFGAAKIQKNESSSNRNMRNVTNEELDAAVKRSQNNNVNYGTDTLQLQSSAIMPGKRTLYLAPSVFEKSDDKPNMYAVLSNKN